MSLDERELDIIDAETTAEVDEMFEQFEREFKGERGEQPAEEVESGS